MRSETPVLIDADKANGAVLTAEYVAELKAIMPVFGVTFEGQPIIPIRDGEIAALCDSHETLRAKLALRDAAVGRGETPEPNLLAERESALTDAIKAITPLKDDNVTTAYQIAFNAAVTTCGLAVWQLREQVRSALRAVGRGVETTPRCEGRYPIGMKRDEPFPVTYRCALEAGHAGECGPDRPQPISTDTNDRPQPIAVETREALAQRPTLADCVYCANGNTPKMTNFGPMHSTSIGDVMCRFPPAEPPATVPARVEGTEDGDK